MTYLGEKGEEYSMKTRNRGRGLRRVLRFRVVRSASAASSQAKDVVEE